MALAQHPQNICKRVALFSEYIILPIFHTLLFIFHSTIAVQEGSRRFKKVQGSKRFKVQKDSRMWSKKTQRVKEGSRKVNRFHEGSSLFMKFHEGSIG